jgi:IPT/TIG domain
MKPRIALLCVSHSLATVGLAGMILLSTSCGGGNSAGGGSGGSGAPPPNIPSLTTISPTSATAQSSAVGLTLLGSNFEKSAIVQWNGSAISSSWVSSTLMTAAIPASNLASVGSAKVTVTNPSAGGGTSAAQTFTIVDEPTSATWVRTVTGISAPQDVVWDASHGMLYASVGSADTVSPNTIIALNPVTGAAVKTVDVGNNPDLLSISSDSSYLWAGMDGDSAVQRFLLPGLTKDISFPVPLDPSGNPQQAVSLRAVPVSPHTLALVAGHWFYSPVGEGVHVYDDATQRPMSVPGWGPFGGGPMIDWIQWGANDSTIYGNQYTTGDAGGVATLNVTSSGVLFATYNGGQIGPGYTQYDSNKGLLYATGSYFFGRTFNPVDGSLVGSFRLPLLGREACTADSSLGRYYCVDVHAIIGSLYQYELLVLDLNTYTLLDRVYFGTNAGQPISPVTGAPARLVRWGNAGLALTTNTQPYYGNGGVFLINGSAVNPKAAPDISEGAPTRSFSWMASLTPQQASANSGDVTVTINGNHFTKNSAACWNCNFLQFQFLPTGYVSPAQLSVTIPANLLTGNATLPINVFDSGSNLFSTNSLTFTVTPASSSNTKVTAVDLAGFAMAWDPHSALLYVGTANFDGAYPNSIVAINAETGSIVKSQTVSSDPDLVSVSSNGQYLYAAFAGATVMTQLQLPGLGSPLTWALRNPASSAVFFAGDMRTAPMSPHTTAVTLFDEQSIPEETGGVVIYDDNLVRQNFAPGWNGGQTVLAAYDTIAWSSSDQILTAACFFGCLSSVPISPLYEFQITQSGAAFVAAGPSSFGQGEIHSDFGTGLIYNDDGNVGDPNTQAVVGTYNASGLVAPDSSLNRVFILGQTTAQANTNNFTVESFDEKAYTPVSAITLENIVGSPIQFVRWGNSGLAVLTINGGSGSQGMLYLIQDTTFVSSAPRTGSLVSKAQGLVQRRWNRVSKADIVKMGQAK